MGFHLSEQWQTNNCISCFVVHCMLPATKPCSNQATNTLNTCLLPWEADMPAAIARAIFALACRSELHFAAVQCRKQTFRH